MSEKKAGGHTKKVKTMALSVLLAVIVWFMVVYVTDPDITTTVSDLNVRFVGETSLREKGMAITGRDNIPELAVIVTGKRSDLMNFMDDIYIQVNVSDITKTGEYNLTGAISLPTTRITVEKEKYSDIPITVEKLETKDIVVSVKQEGTRKDKIIASSAANPKITITGAKSETDKVKGAVATINISDIESDGTKKVNYLLVDEAGALIDKNETIESTRSYVEVINTVYEPKIMPVTAMLSAELGTDYLLKSDKTAVTPASVTVGADSSSTEERLIVYIDKLSADGEGEFKITAPSGIYIPEDMKKVRVKYEAVKKATTELTLPVQAENVTAGLSARIEGELTAKVWGEEGKVSADTVKAVVDVKGLGAGAYLLPVKLEGENVGLAEQYTVNVVIE